MIALLLLASSSSLKVALYTDDVGGPHPASTSSVDALEFGLGVAGSARSPAP